MIYKHDHDFKFSNDRFGLNGILIGVYKNVLSSSKINDRYFAFSLKRCIFASNFRSSHFEPVLRCFYNINFCVFSSTKHITNERYLNKTVHIIVK